MSEQTSEKQEGLRDFFSWASNMVAVIREERMRHAATEVDAAIKSFAFRVRCGDAPTSRTLEQAFENSCRPVIVREFLNTFTQNLDACLGQRP